MSATCVWSAVDHLYRQDAAPPWGSCWDRCLSGRQQPDRQTWTDFKTVTLNVQAGWERAPLCNRENGDNLSVTGRLRVWSEDTADKRGFAPLFLSNEIKLSPKLQEQKMEKLLFSLSTSVRFRGFILCLLLTTSSAQQILKTTASLVPAVLFQA